MGDEETDDFQLLTSALDSQTQDELLTPLGRLQKYASNDNGFNRLVNKLTNLVLYTATDDTYLVKTAVFYMHSVV